MFCDIDLHMPGVEAAAKRGTQHQQTAYQPDRKSNRRTHGESVLVVTSLASVARLCLSAFGLRNEPDQGEVWISSCAALLLKSRGSDGAASPHGIRRCRRPTRRCILNPDQTGTEAIYGIWCRKHKPRRFCGHRSRHLGNPSPNRMKIRRGIRTTARPPLPFSPSSSEGHARAHPAYHTS